MIPAPVLASVTHLHRMWRFVVVGAALLAIATALTPVRANGQIPGAFTVTARADSYTVTVIDRSLPVIPEGTVTSSTSSAQALLNSLGQSQGFAAGPDLGFVATLPPTINGFLAGQAPPLPGYPLQVASDHPTQRESTQEAGPYRLEARSNATRSFAQNRMGASTASPRVLSAISTAEVAKDDATGQIVAQASTTTEALTISDLLRIGRTESTASATLVPGQGPKLESTFEVGLLTDAGVRITVDRQGLHIADSTVPHDLSTVIEQLATRGLTVEYIPEERSETSIVSAGLAVSFAQKVPTHDEITTRLVLGRTAASIDASQPPTRRGGKTIRPPAASPAPSPSTPTAPTAPSRSEMPEIPMPTTPSNPTTAIENGPEVMPTAPASVVEVPGDWANWRIYLAVVVVAGLTILGTRAVAAFGIKLDSSRHLVARDTPSLNIAIRWTRE